MDLFYDRTLLITGGTGSFGNAVLKRFLKSTIKEALGTNIPIIKLSKQTPL